MSRLYLIFICILLVGTVACNTSGNNGVHESGPGVYAEAQDPLAIEDSTVRPTEDSTWPYVDSFKIEMDSLLAAKIVLPPVYKHDVVAANDEAAARFTELSKACNGKMKILVNSGIVAQEIAYTIKAASVPQSDLLILIDKTYSMSDDIATVKKGLGQIIDTIKRRKGTRLAIAFYGDKNYDGMAWYSFKNFETDYDEALKYLEGVKVTGGGDIPESVYDAVMKSMEQDFWKSEKKRNIILVGDAPPLEKPKSDYSLQDVVNRSKEGKMRMNFYPIIIMPEIEEVKLPASEVIKYREIKLTTLLYPNPTKGQINVGFQENGTYYMELYNSNGAMVISEEFYGISWTRELGNIPDGMYVLRVIKADHTYELMKFILRK